MKNRLSIQADSSSLLRRGGVILCAAISAGLGGCRNSPPSRPLSSASFYQVPAESSDSQTDQSAALPAPNPRPASNVSQSETPARPTDADSASSAQAQPDRQQPPATGPIDGGYLTLGAVLAEVNGRAIYADEVLADVSDALHEKAISLDEGAYKAAAGDLIRHALNARISNELAYTAAEHFLSSDEKRLADTVTERWRQEKITEAGGSLQRARSRAAEKGLDFDAMVRRQARLFTIDVYREKKIVPKVQVTVEDMRHYYQRNRDKLYTQSPAAHFLLIQVDPQRSGGREEAMKKIQDIRRRALGGEDFGKLSHDMSDSALLRGQNGDVGWVDKDAFRQEAVEKAAWALRPGDISNVIDTDGAFYLVKLIALRHKQVLPFDNEQVQSQIRQTLRSRQMAELLHQAEQQLRKNAAVSQNPQAMIVTMEMAMQKYAQWHRDATQPKAK